MRVLARWVGRDDGLTAPLGEPVAQATGIVGPIGDQGLGCGNASQQSLGACEVMDLPGGDGEGPRAAVFVGYGVNLGRPSAARSSDGIVEGPPFAPAAERWALMCVESTEAAPPMPLEPLRT